MRRMHGVVLAACLIAAQNVRAENLGARCASVGDDDRTAAIPAELAPKAAPLFGFPAASLGWVEKSTVRRCMDGAVWLCNFGANSDLRQGRRQPRIERRRGLLPPESRGARRPDGGDRP